MIEIGQSDGAQNDPYKGGGPLVVRESSTPVTTITVGHGLPEIRVVLPEDDARVRAALQMYVDLARSRIVLQIPRFASFSDTARETHLVQTVESVVQQVVIETGGRIAPADVAHRVIMAAVQDLSQKLRMNSGEAA